MNRAAMKTRRVRTTVVGFGMSRMSDSGCMLRGASALFGALFFPVGASFLYVNFRAYWAEGLGLIVASGLFFAVAIKAYRIVGIDAVPNEADDDRGRTAPPNP